MQAQQSHYELRCRQIFAVLLAVLTAIVYLRISQLTGRLSADLTYDDVGYANDAAHRFRVLAEHGLFAAAGTFLESPPHSPFSTLLAMAGFAVGGISEFAMYAANTLLLVVVALFVSYELRFARRIILLLALGIVLFSPIAYRAIHDFRPDIASGLATAAMAWWFVGGIAEDEPGLFRNAGYMLGACLLIKPSFFAHTLAIAVFLIGLAVLVRFLAQRGLSFKSGPKISEAAWFPGLGLLVSGSYYLVNGANTFRYFWQNTRGNHAYFWSFPKNTSITELLRGTWQLTFPILGYHLFFAGVVLLLCGTWLLVKGAKKDLVRIVGVFITALVSLGIIVFGRHKNEFFLASFQWMILLCAIYALAALDNQLKGKIRTLFLGLMTIGLLVAMSKNETLTHREISPEALRGNSWNKKIVDIIREYQFSTIGIDKSGSAPTVFVSSTGPVEAQTLRWVGAREGFNLKTKSLIFSADLTRAKSSAERATYVVLPNELTADYYRWVPSAAIQSALLEWIMNDARFKPLTSLSRESNYFVFVNVSVFDANRGSLNINGIALLEGFLGEEGPYPQWSLPRVRWMNKDTAKLCVLNSQIVPHRVALRFRANSAGQFNISDAEGKTLAAVGLTPGKFMDVSFIYTPKAPKNCLNFSVHIETPPNPEQLLLFSKIELRSE